MISRRSLLLATPALILPKQSCAQMVGVEGINNPNISSSSPPGYIASAVHLDGSTYLTNDSLVTPNPTALFSGVWWFKTVQNGAEPTFFVIDPDCMVVPYISIPVGNLDIEVTDAFEANSSPATYKDGQWHCLIFSVDVTSMPNKKRFYIDDVDITFSIAGAGGTHTINGNGEKAQVGYDNTGAGGFYIGDLSDYRIFYGVSLLNGSGDIPLATRRLFIDGSGKPVDPAVATAALGAATVLFSGDATAFAINQGGGGSFTTTGTLTNASTHP